MLCLGRFGGALRARLWASVGEADTLHSSLQEKLCTELLFVVSILYSSNTKHMQLQKSERVAQLCHAFVGYKCCTAPLTLCTEFL